MASVSSNICSIKWVGQNGDPLGKDEKMEKVFVSSFETPVGTVRVASSGEGLCRVALPSESDEAFLAWLGDSFPGASIEPGETENHQVEEQLIGYFSGRTKEFSVPLDLKGTAFQTRVWKAIAEIPHGQTRSYADIAARIGQPRACRAVGGANRANPIPIIIPCHRVVGANGSLTGYGGPQGVGLKARLLELEGVACTEDSRVAIPPSRATSQEVGS